MVNLTIDPGESVPSITGKLWQEGLISNPGVFRSYLQYTGLDTRLKAGEYKLSPNLSPIEIAQAIQSSISADVTLTILPGWRAEEIANALPTSGFNITAEEFFSAVHGPIRMDIAFPLAWRMIHSKAFCFPAVILLPRESTINDLLLPNPDEFRNPGQPRNAQWFYNPGFRPVPGSHSCFNRPERKPWLEEEMPHDCICVL